MLKGYKITDSARTRICGLTGSSVKELKSKACAKLKILNPSEFHFLLLDGTIVDNDDYLNTLPSQTLLILANKKTDVSAGADIVYNALKAVNIDYLRSGIAIKQFFEENIKEKLKILTNYLVKPGDAECAYLKSNRKDDPKWFEGLETNCSTKEAFLRRRCKDRITSYFYKAKSDLTKSRTDTTEREIIERLLNKLKEKLQKSDYQGGYFDRKDELRICDEFGSFKCNGVWNKEKCLYNGNNSHVINPYSTREERIVFSTWNLDHRIEKSRTIMPGILSVIKSIVQNKSIYDFNYDLIYKLLFTSENLRLVHIVCHDKGAHTTASLKPKEFLVKLSNGIKKDT